jgi:leucyl-tRNA synthetase
MNDPDWRKETVRDVKTKLHGFQKLTDSIIENAKQAETGHLETWLVSTLQHRIKTVTENMEALKTRAALENALFEIWNDFRWYNRRKENLNSNVLKQALETWTRLLAPFAPYMCEEIWSKMGHKTFVSSFEWPAYDKNRVDVQAEETENTVKNVLEDTSNILRATKMVPKEIYYYSAASWKWKVYVTALKKSVSGTITISDLMKTLMSDPELKTVAGKVAKFAQALTEEINRMPEDMKQRQLQTGALDEAKLLETAETFFGREFNAKIHVYREDDNQICDPQRKAGYAKPYRPAIYVV